MKVSEIERDIQNFEATWQSLNKRLLRITGDLNEKRQELVKVVFFEKILPILESLGAKLTTTLNLRFEDLNDDVYSDLQDLTSDYGNDDNRFYFDYTGLNIHFGLSRSENENTFILDVRSSKDNYFDKLINLFSSEFSEIEITNVKKLKNYLKQRSAENRKLKNRRMEFLEFLIKNHN